MKYSFNQANRREGAFSGQRLLLLDEEKTDGDVGLSGAGVRRL